MLESSKYSSSRIGIDSSMDAGMNPENAPVINDDAEVLITVRAIMQGREVGSIIGRKGETIRKLKEDSGCNIFITDGSSRERILSVTGFIAGIYKAFSAITRSVQQYFENRQDYQNIATVPLIFKIVVPSVQCGAIIGKGGSNIKNLMQTTGASVHVASDMLPESTERLVTLTGTPEAVTRCIHEICTILMTATPSRGIVIPFRPKPIKPMLNTGNTDPGDGTLLSLEGLLTLSHLLGFKTAGPANPDVLRMVNMINQANAQPVSSEIVTKDITVPNEFVGYIIGQGGTKIAEIRKLSKANVNIPAETETIKTPNGMERPITLRGCPSSIDIAESLIFWCVECRKNQIYEQDAADDTTMLENIATTANPSNLIPLVGNTDYDVSNNVRTANKSSISDTTGSHSSNHDVDCFDHQDQKVHSPRIHNVSGDSKSRTTVRNKFAPY